VGLTIGARAQQPSSTGAPGARSPYVAADNRPQGWAARDLPDNTLGWPANKPLWNTAKTKLLDGKQLRSFSISQPDPELFCQMAPHYRTCLGIEMQHSTLSWPMCEAYCRMPAGRRDAMIRLAMSLKATLQHATRRRRDRHDEPTVDRLRRRRPSLALRAIRHSVDAARRRSGRIALGRQLSAGSQREHCW